MLQQLYVIFTFQRLCQPLADIATPGKHDSLHRLIQLAHLRHNSTDILGRRDEEDLVIGLDDLVTIRNDTFTAAEDRCHA